VRKAFVNGLFLLILATAHTAFGAGFPDSGVLDFAILRNGTEIGSHVIRLGKPGDPTIVRIEAKVDYRIAFIPLYMFRHAAREIWRGGRFVGMTAETNDNGDDYRVAVTANGDALKLSINGAVAPIDTGLVPASLWNIALVGHETVLDPADGDLMKVSIRESGEETIDVRGRQVRARRYVMTGDFERDLWYDRRQVLVQVLFKGEDGSEIRYKLR
jgi:hypothetical protein